jgi:hypothetical protein
MSHENGIVEVNQDSSQNKPTRKINRSNQQLKRYAACMPCRKRRIKCDAGKPHCSSCIRSFEFLKRTQPDEERDSMGIQCWYDGVEDETTSGIKRKGEFETREDVKRLEERIGKES